MRRSSSLRPVRTVLAIICYGAASSAAPASMPDSPRTVVSGRNDQAPLAATPPGLRIAGSASVLAGREADAKAATIAFRLAVAGRPRCPVPIPNMGVVLQHLTQFERENRRQVGIDYGLDRGPGIIALVAEGPAANAGLRPGDILLAIDGVALPPEPARDVPFSAPIAHARADSVAARLEERSDRAVRVDYLRGVTKGTVMVTARAACPSRIHLARSDQRNAYADGVHVFLTTGLLRRMNNDHELAFVIAHEMAHNILRHAAAMRAGEVRRGIGRMFGRSGRVVRDSERAADLLGGELMLDAGYDPVTGAAVLRGLGSDLGIALFAAHDSTDKRLAAMHRLVEGRRAR